MKNKSFGILILSLLGYFLIVLSIFFLYQGINTTREEVKETKKELDIAKKKIEKLSNQLVEKNSLSRKVHSVIFTNSDEFNTMLGKNIPLIEITDLDLSNKNRISKKSGKLLTYQFRFYIFNIGKN
jgi:predicted tellurium resistance membrane protein TerC